MSTLGCVCLSIRHIWFSVSSWYKMSHLRCGLGLSVFSSPYPGWNGYRPSGLSPQLYFVVFKQRKKQLVTGWNVMLIQSDSLKGVLVCLSGKLLTIEVKRWWQWSEVVAVVMMSDKAQRDHSAPGGGESNPLLGPLSDALPHPEGPMGVSRGLMQQLESLPPEDTTFMFYFFL